MNETTSKLLEQLANKLGTTSEYLWGVLLKQAPIAATTRLIQTILVIISGVILLKVHQRLLKVENPNDVYSRSLYEKHGEFASIPMVICLLIFSIFFIFTIGCFGTIINGYFSPEYWALKEILDSFKN